MPPHLVSNLPLELTAGIAYFLHYTSLFNLLLLAPLLFVGVVPGPHLCALPPTHPLVFPQYPLNLVPAQLHVTCLHPLGWAVHAMKAER